MLSFKVYVNVFIGEIQNNDNATFLDIHETA